MKHHLQIYRNFGVNCFAQLLESTTNISIVWKGILKKMEGLNKDPWRSFWICVILPLSFFIQIKKLHLECVGNARIKSIILFKPPYIFLWWRKVAEGLQNILYIYFLIDKGKIVINYSSMFSMLCVYNAYKFPVSYISFISYEYWGFGKIKLIMFYNIITVIFNKLCWYLCLIKYHNNTHIKHL